MEGEVIQYVKTHPECVERMYLQCVWTPMEYLRYAFAKRIGHVVGYEKRYPFKSGKCIGLSHLTLSEHIQEAIDTLLCWYYGTTLTAAAGGMMSNWNELCGWEVYWKKDNVYFVKEKTGERETYPFPNGWSSPVPLSQWNSETNEENKLNMMCLADYDAVVMPYMERIWPIIAQFYEEKREK